MPSMALIWDLIAVDNASGTFRKVGAEAEGAHGAVGKLGAALGAAALGAALGDAVKKAADFQSEMLLIRTQAGDTTDNLNDMSKSILGLAGKTAQAPEALANSLYHVTSTGLRGKDALNEVEAAAKLATLSHSNLEETTNALTSAYASGIPGIKSFDQAVGVLNATVGSGDMKMSDLNAALSSGILVNMKGYGLSIQDVGAALATFGDLNVRGSDASTMLRMGVQAMVAPVRGGAKVLAELGINTKDQMAGFNKLGLTATALANDLQTGGLNKAMADLRDHLNKAGISGTQVGDILTQAFGKKAGPGLSILLGQFDRLQSKYVDINKQGNDFQSVWADTQKTAKFAFDSLKQSLDVLMIRVGTALLPVLTSVANWVTQSGLPAIEKFGGAIANAFKGASNGDFFSNVKKAADGLWTTLTNFVNSKGFQNFLQGAADAAKALWKGITDLSMVLGPLAEAVRIAGQVLAPMVGWVGDIAKGFAGLPGPIRDAVAAIGLLKAASLVGLFTPITAGAGLVTAGFGRVQGAFQNFRTDISATSGVLRSAGIPMAGFAATLQTSAERAVGGLGKLVNFMGGPIVLGAAALTTMFVGATKEVDDWASALEQGGHTAEEATAQMQDAHNKSILDAGSLSDAWTIVKDGFADGLSQIKGYSSALDEAQHKAQDWYDHLDRSQQITQNLKVDTANLDDAIAQYGQNSSEAKYQAWLLNQALGDQQTAQALTDQATRGTNGALSTQLGLQQQLSQAGVSLDQATLSSKQSIDQYKSSLKDTNLTEDARAQALDQVSQSMFSVLDAAKRKADAETKGMPQQLITNQEIANQRDALDGVVKKLGFVPPALQGMYDSLNGPTAKALEATKTQVNNVGTAMTNVTTGDVPGFLAALDAITHAAGSSFPQAVTGGFLPAAKGAGDAITRTGDLADANGKKVGILGSIINGLPGSHDTKITANTDAAQASIQSFLDKAKSLGFAAAVMPQLGTPVGNGVAKGPIGMPALTRAAGGIINGPGSGTSDSIHAMLSNGEFVVNAKATSANLGLLHAINSGAVAGFAEGGLVWMADLAKSVKDRMGSSLTTGGGSFAPGAPANVSGNVALGKILAGFQGWGSGPEWNALYALWQRESGWNNNAQNPTSTAYGIPQFLNSTWASLGISKTSDAASQINAGLKYIGNRYRDPIGAWGHETSAGWYKNGTNYVPNDQMAVLHKGEAVIPAHANQGAPWQGGGPVEITGTLEIGGDGLARIVNGHLVSSYNGIATTARAGVRR